MTGRTFPIRLDAEIKEVPWEMMAAHEAQAIENHGVTLAILSARGGLTPEEALAVLEDRPFERMGYTASTLMLRRKVLTFLDGAPEPMAPPAPNVRARLEHGIALVQRLRDGKAQPHKAHYNELLAIMEHAHTALK